MLQKYEKKVSWFARIEIFLYFCILLS